MSGREVYQECAKGKKASLAGGNPHDKAGWEKAMTSAVIGHGIAYDTRHVT
jgi:hypothetical protein